MYIQWYTFSRTYIFKENNQNCRLFKPSHLSQNDLLKVSKRNLCFFKLKNVESFKGYKGLKLNVEKT